MSAEPAGASLRLLADMLQTRMEAVVLTVQIERDALWRALRWRCVSIAALLLAGWAALLLLAVWLPEPARIWVLAATTASLALLAAFAQWQLSRFRTQRSPARRQLLDAVRQDLDALATAVSRGGD